MYNKAHKANDASSCWLNYCMMTWLHDSLWLFGRKYWFPLFSIKASPTNEPTDRRTDKPGYRNARTHLKNSSMIQSHLWILPIFFSNQVSVMWTIGHWVMLSKYWMLLDFIMMQRDQRCFKLPVPSHGSNEIPICIGEKWVVLSSTSSYSGPFRTHNKYSCRQHKMTVALCGNHILYTNLKSSPIRTKISVICDIISHHFSPETRRIHMCCPVIFPSLGATLHLLSKGKKWGVLSAKIVFSLSEGIECGSLGSFTH